MTTFNALREAGLAPGADVAVFGLGGLGHLAVQFARAMGYEVTVIARGPGRKAAAEELGAAHYIDAEEGSVGEALHVRGGTDLIICTAPTTTTVPDLLAGLRVGGGLTMIGMDGNSVSVPTTPMVMNSQTLTGHLTGSATDIEDAMRFALVNGIRPWTEIMPLEEAEQAVERMESGEARFRIVLDMSPGRGSRR
ncbi:zinc-binding dehydrogenase [Corynebacterium sp. CNJ-954]|uniref:zinc-binding dehydrogenase n=1 Tax=Corynebacterium sp. CNJ-954 TaxID=1904962 RepID=UPI002101391B|nr:zinc-binding dehydrogenase [Corynebacterium sp. CNJ-954]